MTIFTKSKVNVYQIARDHVLQYLERGIAPWLTSWTHAGIPRNLISKQEYRAINTYLLAALGYPKNFFLTSKQMDDIGATLRPGEEAYPVFYWKPTESGQEKKDKPILRYSYVYNITQCNGISKSRIPKIRKPRFPLEMCVSIVGNMPNKATISHGKLPAVYMSTLDCIEIPKRQHYPSEEIYFSTLFRCLIHSTGHESRLNRKEVMQATVTDFDDLATESLIGDIGASYLASLAGIPYAVRKDAVNYCKEWVIRLKKDPKLIMYASTQAQRAIDYILGRNVEASPKFD